MSVTAKSVVFDIADGISQGGDPSVGIRAIDFYLSGSKITNIETTNFVAYATSTDGAFSAADAFDTSVSKIDAAGSTSWLSAFGSYTNQRLICVFNSNTEFDKIVINNYHEFGAQTSYGAYNVKVYHTTDTVTNTTYGNGIGGYTNIFDDVFGEHTASNIEDDETIYGGSTIEPENVLSGTPVVDQLTLLVGYPDDVVSSSPIIDSPEPGITGDNTFSNVKSVIFDIVDAYTVSAFDYVSVREIDFTYLGVSLGLTSADFTAYATNNRSGQDPEYAFDTSLSLTGDPTYQAWQAGFGTVSDVRLIVVFDSFQTFDNIKVNNYHNYGADTDLGIQNVKIYTSDDAVTNVNYNQDIFDYELIYRSTFDQHSASDVREDQWLLLSDPVLVMDVLTQAPAIASPSAASMGVITGVPDVDSLNAFHVFAPSNVVSGIPDIDELVVELQLLNYSSFDAKIPIAFEMSSGNSLDITLPEMTLAASFYTGRIGDIEATLPSMSFLMTLGSYIDVSLKAFSMTGVITKEELANILLQFPSLSASFKSSFAQTGDIEASLKALQLSLNSISGNVIGLNTTLPKLILINTLISGVTGDLEMTLPMKQLDITSIFSGDNDFEATLPELELVLFGDKLACSVLNYVKGKVR